MSKMMRKVTSIMLTLAMIVTVCPQGELFDIQADHTAITYEK